MRKSNYNDQPKGCRFSTATTKHMVPVVLEDLAVLGSRSQRRWALRELRRLKNKSGENHGD